MATPDEWIHLPGTEGFFTRRVAQINFARKLVRLNRGEFAFESFCAADLRVMSNEDFDTRAHHGRLSNWDHLSLVLHAEPKGELYVELRRGAKLALHPDTQAAVLELIAQSAIVIPKDRTDPGGRFDPRGRFARSAWPSHITKEESLLVVANPPMPNDALPISHW